MKFDKFLKTLSPHTPCDNPEIKFEGIKWQEEHHPSAERFPIDFLKAEQTGKGTITITFITKPHETK